MSEKLQKPRNSRSRWTLDEIHFVEKHYGKMPPAEIAAKLCRTLGALGIMADKLGVRCQQSPLWTEKEEAVLRTHYVAGMEIEQLLQLLPGRPICAVYSRAQRLGLIRGKYWREEECQIVREYYPEHGTAIVGRLPGRTTDLVKLKANELGIKFLGEIGKFRIWSEEEWFLLEKCQHLSVAEQMLLLPGRSRSALEKAKARLKARKKLGQ